MQIPTYLNNLELPLTINQVVRNHVVSVLTAVGGNKTKAAGALGIHRRSLYRLLHAYQVACPSCGELVVHTSNCRLSITQGP